MAETCAIYTSDSKLELAGTACRQAAATPMSSSRRARRAGQQQLAAKVARQAPELAAQPISFEPICCHSNI